MRKGKRPFRHEGKGKGEIDEQKDWEVWWLVKEIRWANEQWVRVSGDDLDMGETEQRLRQEQWDAVRSAKLRNEMLGMGECLGEEMASEVGRESRCRIRDWRMERKRESHGRWESPVEESGFDSVEEMIRRLTEGIDELESRERWGGEGQMAKGSSSESDEGNGRWKWDGRAWWCRVDTMDR